MASPSGLRIEPNPTVKLPQISINRQVYLQTALRQDAGYLSRHLTEIIFQCGNRSRDLVNVWKNSEVDNYPRLCLKNHKIHKTPLQDLKYETDVNPERLVRRTVRKMIKNAEFGNCIKNSVPIVQWLPKYKLRQYLVNDIIAGITTAVMQIPQGMAYALLAELPPIVGLYMAFFPLLMYIILGNSPHVSLGTFAVACLMTGKVVHEFSNKPLENGVTYSPIEIATVLTFLVGLIQIVMWVLRLGAISSLLSKPMVSGFTTAAAMHVCASQLKDLFGLTIPKLPPNGKVVNTVIEIIKRLDAINLTALLISFITCLFLALCKERLKPWLMKWTRIPFPSELIAVAAGPLACNFFNLREDYGISVVGHIPTGLPIPRLPPLELMEHMILDGITQTVVTYTVTLSMGLIFAAKDKYQIDANQELLAMGASNIFASFFSCAPMCASLSRSYIQYSVIGSFSSLRNRATDNFLYFVTTNLSNVAYLSGCKSLITSAVCAILMLLVLLWIGPFFEELPRCVLASVIVIALKGLFMQVLDLCQFNKLSKISAFVWLFTFLVTLLVALDIGLCAGIIASITSLFLRSQTPYVCLLGRLGQTDIYLDVKRYRGVQELPGIKILRYNGSLNHTNTDLFRNKLFRKIYYHHHIKISLRQLKQDAKIATPEWTEPFPVKLQCVIVEASGFSYIDVQGIQILVNVQNELALLDITLLIACMTDPIIEMIEHFNAIEDDKLTAPMFPTVHDAVLFFQAKTEESTAQKTVL